jgi:type IV fimbrial biogenesis protein FimT
MDRPGGRRCHSGGSARTPAAAGGAPAISSGFTLIEMLIALAIASLLVALATPDWRSRNARAELRDRANALVEVMSVARSEAVKRGTRVDVCPSVDRMQCVAGAGWETGWLSLVHDAGDHPPQPRATILRREGPARSGITIRANRPLADYVSFTSLGHARRHDGALQMGTFTVCRSGHEAFKVVLANSGRVRVDATREACP